MNLFGFVKLKLHFGMQNEKYINNKSSKDPSDLFHVFFFYFGQIILCSNTTGPVRVSAR